MPPPRRQGVGTRACVLPFLCIALPTVTEAKLYKLIVVSRHGIRVPFPPDHGADAYSQDGREWFTNATAWGANATACLTDHGATVLSKMGGYFTHNLTTGSDAILSGTCDGLGKVTVYADEDSTKRDIKSAQAFFKGMYPGCSPPFIHHEQPYTASLFNQVPLSRLSLKLRLRKRFCTRPNIIHQQGNLVSNTSSVCNGPSRREIEVRTTSTNQLFDCIVQSVIDAVLSSRS